MGKNLIGLKIILGSGQFIAVALPEEEANKFHQDWLSGEMALRGNKRVGGIMTDGYRWAVDVTQVVAVHTFDISNVPGMAPVTSGQQQPVGPGFLRR